MKSPQIRGLYYITHIDNVPSILRRGILCHERIEAEHVEYTHIYDKDIVANRHDIHVPDGRSLWEFANFYFQHIINRSQYIFDNALFYTFPFCYLILKLIFSFENSKFHRQNFL